MKRNLLSILVALLPVVASAFGEIVIGYNAYVDGIFYNLSGDEAEVTFQEYDEYNGVYISNYTGNIVLPASITYNGKTYRVTGIRSYAFADCKNLLSVTIPESVTSIGEEGTFSDCSSLVSATIPGSVKNLGSLAFFCCSSLKSVTLEDGVTSIGYRAFGDCSSLTSVTIPNSLASMETDAFNGCKSLTDVTIPGSVTSIGKGAFKGCSSLTSLTIEDGVEIIGNGAFYGCSIASVTLPASVTSIGTGAFSQCSSLADVTFPETVTHVGAEAFNGTPWFDNQPDGLVYIGKVAFRYKGGMPEGTEISIEDGTVQLADYAFSDYTGLVSIILPESVKRISSYAFSGCKGLTYITIPESVTSIGSYAFSGCRSLTSIAIPNGVTDISDGVFNVCPSLTSVIIPDGVKSIGDSAFDDCISLTSVKLPESLTSIGKWTFIGCKGLTSIVIPNNVTSIGYAAFSKCSGLKTVTISNSIEQIDKFAFNACSSLTDVFCLAENVPSAQSNTFKDSPITSATLHVPEGSVEAYKAKAPWSEFGNIVEMTTSGKLLPFVQDGKVWTYEVSNFIHDWEETFSLEGDTVIGSRNCLKLYYSCQVYNQNRLYKGAMFEEGGNVYIIVPDSTTPLLMYDFSCEPETIIKVGEFKLKIKEKKLVKYHDEYLRVIDYTIPENEDYPFEGVEGVGFLGGGLTCLLDGYAPGSTGGERYLKTCTLNGVVVYEQHDFYTSAQIIKEDDVTFTKDQMATIILPIAPDAGKGKYYRLDRCEDGKIIFEQEKQPQAHIPYIIVPSEDFSIETSTLDLAGLSPDTVSIKGIDFIGTYTGKVLPSLGGEGGGFFYYDIIDTTPDCTPLPGEGQGERLFIGALRAYLTVNWDDPISHSGSKGPDDKMGIVLKDKGTGLTPTLSKGEGVIYDLSGRRLSGKPAKGVYINDGKKFIAQ